MCTHETGLISTSGLKSDSNIVPDTHTYIQSRTWSDYSTITRSEVKTKFHYTLASSELAPNQLV